jgi:hypothetical protein
MGLSLSSVTSPLNKSHYNISPIFYHYLRLHVDKLVSKSIRQNMCKIVVLKYIAIS